MSNITQTTNSGITNCWAQCELQSPVVSSVPVYVVSRQSFILWARSIEEMNSGVLAVVCERSQVSLVFFF